MSKTEYEFMEDWFSRNIKEWDEIIPQIDPARILEVGSYEGQSSCYFIERLGSRHDIELHCVDTWEGAAEHAGADMAAVERRFDTNVERARRAAAHVVTVVKHRARSDAALPALIADDGVAPFDLVYVDGSHLAPDVLADAVLCFKLLRVNGLMIFDDYLWGLGPQGPRDPLASPKIAVDAFLNIFQQKMVIVRDVPLHQIFALKTAD